MAFQTLLRETAQFGVGPAALFPDTDQVREFQIVPHPAGFTGTLVLEASSAPEPGAGDWFPMATITLEAHTTTFAFDLHLNRPWMRVNVTRSKMGTISVHVSN